MKIIKTFKLGEEIPSDSKFLFFHPGDQAYHYEVNVKKEMKPSQAKEHIVQVINYLNHVTGSKYSPDSKASERLILARINEGRMISDFKKVIDRKFLDWGHDPQWAAYLRPETLFGSKFDSYLGGVADQQDPFSDLEKEMEKIK